MKTMTRFLGAALLCALSASASASDYVEGYKYNQELGKCDVTGEYDQGLYPGAKIKIFEKCGKEVFINDYLVEAVAISKDSIEIYFVGGDKYNPFHVENY